jgi:hypothetical protein
MDVKKVNSVINFVKTREWFGDDVRETLRRHSRNDITVGEMIAILKAFQVEHKVIWWPLRGQAKGVTVFVPMLTEDGEPGYWEAGKWVPTAPTDDVNSKYWNKLISSPVVIPAAQLPGFA